LQALLYPSNGTLMCPCSTHGEYGDFDKIHRKLSGDPVTALLVLCHQQLSVHLFSQDATKRKQQVLHVYGTG